MNEGKVSSHHQSASTFCVFVCEKPAIRYIDNRTGRRHVCSIGQHRHSNATFAHQWNNNNNDDEEDVDDEEEEEEKKMMRKKRIVSEREIEDRTGQTERLDESARWGCEM